MHGGQWTLVKNIRFHSLYLLSIMLEYQTISDLLLMSQNIIGVLHTKFPLPGTIEECHYQ